MKYRMKDGTLLELRSQLPTGAHTRRVGKLEVWMQSAVAKADRRTTDQEWLEMFTLYARQGLFDQEPDFPQALKEYQDAIRQVSEDPTQHYFPPPEFMPHASEPYRVSNWREGRHYPEILRALLWLASMLDRVTRQAPGVSLAEWESLKSWFQENAQELQGDSEVHHLLEQDELALPELTKQVEEDDGKTLDTNKLIHQLRKLWACRYRAAVN